MSDYSLRSQCEIQWGFKNWTSLDFEYSKRDWVADGPDFEWDLKSRIPTICFVCLLYQYHQLFIEIERENTSCMS